MEKQSVTIYTVAREARVSMATVSRVVNGNPNVKPETRQKVLDVIKQLNYRPNAVARGLASKKTTTVGVVIPNITDPYFAELALGIDDVASMYKYNIILTNSDSDDEKILKVVRSLLAKQVDGLIFMGHDVSDDLRNEFESTNTPVVVAGSVVNDDALPSVRINYQAAAKEATEFLLKHGDQQVAYITGPLRYSINGEDRLNGYKEALANNNVPFNELLVIETDGSYQAGYAKAQEVIEKGLKAAYVTDDSLAAGLLNGLTDADISVPDDFELISSNDTNYTKVVRPTITSITQPLYDLGAISMRLLTKLMDGDDSNDDEKNVILDHGFVERQSTRK
ncbi:catabolite control protein A [Limosilactobacillus reuteri]|uniref:catabolite control protein A n=1 Tax=Limosilactobacillus reuteri TaxID=1598 RepID=UPI00128CBD9F|nr:catabolite control protein A [Limosilactobacillus reuteri]MBB1070861.1 catabolite control protein A [Limosilactobacillus reuteri]MCC4510381.1 catabolite control protein A [Limosilactobacillus reuteri]MCC4511928.1 catabolite control protein A [Limosilactobacillus reuteri]MCU4692195.1 catabolite control protein A [Limosilactobacillus reuteri]MQB74640.1 catabolite control protein A [Limosilactobacillus reuteri]